MNHTIASRTAVPGRPFPVGGLFGRPLRRLGLAAALAAAAGPSIPRETWAQTLHEDEPPPLVLDVVRGSHARTERSVTVAVRVSNHSDSKVVLYWRRALMSFRVSGPTGLVECPREPDLRHAPRRAFVTLRPGASRTLTVRLVEICPRGTFDKRGEYHIEGQYETAQDGSDFGFEAFTGEIQGRKPAVVHVRRDIRLLEIHPVAPPAKAAPPPPAKPGSRPPPRRPPPPPRPRRR